MSANGNAAAAPKVCPVCQDPFNAGANLPKIFGVCGHSVCAVCVPGCIRQPTGHLTGRAKCPLCRQETPVPAKGLAINYGLKDELEAQQADNAANVKCSACDNYAPSSYVFACKTCTIIEKNIVVVCPMCFANAHQGHAVVVYNGLAKTADVVSVIQKERHHNDTVQRHTTELASTIAQEMKRLAKECLVDVDANLSLSLMTKDEHDIHEKNTAERRLRSTRALDAAERIIARCRQELSEVRTDDMQTSGVQEALSSNSMRGQKRAAPWSDTEYEVPHSSPLDLRNFQNVLAQSSPDVRALLNETMTRSVLSLNGKRQILKSFMELHAKSELNARNFGNIVTNIRDREANGTKRTKHD